jgi:protein TonB
MNAAPSVQIDNMHLNIRKQVKRIGPLGVIILLHLAFFYVLQSGMIKQTTQVFPKEVFATFITPERAQEATPPKERVKPEPKPEPKTVPVVKKSVAPPLPAVSTPSPMAAAAPPSAPEPVAPAAAAPPAPAPAPITPAAPRTISSGVEYIQAPRPEYPAIAKRMGEEGQVILRVLINEKGRSERVEIQKTSGSPRLDEAGRQAVQRALFKPYTENGQPMAVYAIVPIKFQLEN